MPLFNHSFTTKTEHFWRKLHDFAAQGSKNPLVAACVFGFSRNFSLLFQSMLDIGDTCLDELLFIACRFGYLKLVHYLFLEDADASAEDWKGQTPLHFAAESGHEPIVLLLLNKGSDASATN
jgi:hypothetical protein